MTLQAWQTHFERFLQLFFAEPLNLHQVEKGALVNSNVQISPEMFNWIQVWLLGQSRTFTKWFWSHSFVILAVCLGYVRFSFLHKAILELCQSHHWDPTGSWSLLRLSTPNQSDRPGSQLWEEFLVLLFPFTDDGGHCTHWDLQCSRKFFSTPSQIYVLIQFSLGVYRLGLQATLYPVRYENYPLSTLHCKVPTWHTSLKIVSLYSLIFCVP